MSKSYVQEFRLSNGMTVFGLHPTATQELYDEIKDRPYLKHGIELKSGDRIFDIGANVGLFILLLEGLADNLEVFAFEPIPDTFEALKRNVERHSRQSVHLFNVGVSDRACQTTFTFFPRSPSASTMDAKAQGVSEAEFVELILERMRTLPNLPLRWSVALLPTFARRMIAERVRRYYNHAVQVPCALERLSDVIDRKQVDRIDLLKIDAEGAEHGIVAAIRPEHWPMIRQVVIEVHDGEEGRRRMQARLEELGFRVHVEQDKQFSKLCLLFGRRA